jgi:hypothetical protein
MSICRSLAGPPGQGYGGNGYSMEEQEYLISCLKRTTATLTSICEAFHDRVSKFAMDDQMRVCILISPPPPFHVGQYPRRSAHAVQQHYRSFRAYYDQQSVRRKMCVLRRPSIAALLEWRLNLDLSLAYRTLRPENRPIYSEEEKRALVRLLRRHHAVEKAARLFSKQVRPSLINWAIGWLISWDLVFAVSSPNSKVSFDAILQEHRRVQKATRRT